MKFDNSTTLKLGNHTYSLKYDINALIKLEALISTKNIARMIANYPLSHSDTIICLMAGLDKDYPSMNMNKAKNLFSQMLKEYSISDVQNVILEALLKSGAMGKVEEQEAAEQGE